MAEIRVRVTRAHWEQGKPCNHFHCGLACAMRDAGLAEPCVCFAIRWLQGGQRQRREKGHSVVNVIGAHDMRTNPEDMPTGTLILPDNPEEPARFEQDATEEGK